MTDYLSAAWRYISRVANAIGSFCGELFREFIDNGCQRSAAALTYMTLFALVPMMTVTYTMFSVVPAFDGVPEQLQSIIFDHFLPETGNEVSQYLSDFSAQARSLTKAGVVMLLITAFLMLRNIEKTFNSIWGVKQARGGMVGYLLYWAVLSIGPLLLGAGFVISTYLLSLRLVVDELSQMGIAAILASGLPMLFSSIAFTLLFVAVPNCRVPLRYGVVGGLLSALCFEALKSLFGYIVANSSFKLVYGAFAAVPLFLLWLNLLWTIILAGAVFVRTLSEHAYSARVMRYSDLIAVLRCLSLFRQKSSSGEQVSDKDCVGLGLGLVHWQRLRSLLVQQRWIAVTDTGDYVLSHNLRHLSLWDVAALVKFPVGKSLNDVSAALVEPEPWLEEVFERQNKLAGFAREVFTVPLEELFVGQGGDKAVIEHEQTKNK